MAHITGNCWTDRQTVGTVRFTNVVEDVLVPPLALRHQVTGTARALREGTDLPLDRSPSCSFGAMWGAEGLQLPYGRTRCVLRPRPHAPPGCERPDVLGRPQDRRPHPGPVDPRGGPPLQV